MADGSAWAREALCIKQVPTLQGLLRCCDEKLLIRTIVEEHARRAGGWEELSAKRRRGAEKRLAASIAVMRRLPLDKKHTRASLLLPEESYVLQARTGLIERRMAAALVSLDDVPLARRAVERDDAALRRGSPAGPAAEGPWPQPRAYTLDPWGRTLARRVWLGGPWCCRERYAVLASAFWEMTYLGFEYERVCARQAEERARRLADEGATDDGDDRAPAAGDAPVRSVSDERRLEAQAFGLVEPDRFAGDYRDRLAACVGQLNARSRRELCLRLIDVAERLGKA